MELVDENPDSDATIMSIAEQLLEELKYYKDTNTFFESLPGGWSPSVVHLMACFQSPHANQQGNKLCQSTVQLIDKAPLSESCKNSPSHF